MKLITVGNYYCKYCNKEIPANVWANNPELVLEYKEDTIKWCANFHWYNRHYNCAICGKWIPSGERELVLEKDFSKPIHSDYNFDVRDGLLRVHERCVQDL